MNVVNEYGEKRNGFAEVVALCHATCRYFDRFLLQGVDKNWRQAYLFYLALGLICEGYWQVNSRRSIFRIANPNYVQGICSVTGLKQHAFMYACMIHLPPITYMVVFSVSNPSLLVVLHLKTSP